ncbi:MAG: 5-formyltetrahydrofolate cyclo-ligase [Pseudomonadota bacterium]
MTATLRRQALLARRSLSDAERNDAEQHICDRVVHSAAFWSATHIACYFAMADEVDPTSIIKRAWRAKKRIFCPVMRKNGEMDFYSVSPRSRLLQNKYGIWEPIDGEKIDAKSLDLVCSPLVAFDHHRHRIGMGGGYYDRYFAFLRSRKQWVYPKLMGLAYECQKIEEIRPNPWDIRLYSVVTEQKIYR